MRARINKIEVCEIFHDLLDCLSLIYIFLLGLVSFLIRP